MSKFLNFLFPHRMAAYYHAEHMARTYQASQPRNQSKGEQLTTTESPDGALAGNAGNTLRQWGRFLDENSDIVSGALNTLEDEIIGSGITIEPMVARASGEPLDDFNSQIRTLLEGWYQRADVTGEMTMPDLQRLFVRSWMRDGEVFARHVMGRRNYPFAVGQVPYTTQALEAEMCPQDLIEEEPYIVMGVEKSRPWMLPIRYWFYPEHPGSSSAGLGRLFPAGPGGLVALADARPVDAADVEHLKHTERLNQTRGVTIFHAVINTIEDLKDGLESERLAMRVSASLCAFIQRTETGPIETSPGTKDRSFQMSGGMVFDKLLPGETVADIGTNRPNEQLFDFVNHHMRRIASATGLKASSLTRDYSQGSYSSQRQELVEARPHCERLQQHFINRILRPMYARYIDAAILDGKLTVPRTADMSTLYRAAYLTPAIAWIDPLKEIQAWLLEHEAGLVSRSEIMARRGRNPREVRAQLEQEAADPPPVTPTLAVDNTDEDAA